MGVNITRLFLPIRQRWRIANITVETFHKIYKSIYCEGPLSRGSYTSYYTKLGHWLQWNKCQLCRIHACRLSARVFVSWIVEQVPCSGALTIEPDCSFPVSVHSSFRHGERCRYGGRMGEKEGGCASYKASQGSKETNPTSVRVWVSISAEKERSEVYGVSRLPAGRWLWEVL